MQVSVRNVSLFFEGKDGAELNTDPPCDTRICFMFEKGELWDLDVFVKDPNLYIPWPEDSSVPAWPHTVVL